MIAKYSKRKRASFFGLTWVSAFAVFLALALLTPTTSRAADLDFKQWGLLAIQDGGRRKPIDTYARETLMRLTGQAKLTAGGRTWTANDFLLSMLLGTREWKDDPIILMSYRPLVQALELDPAKKRFSITELGAMPKLEALAKEAHEAQIKGKDLTPMQREVQNVSNRIGLYQNLQSGRVLLIIPPKGGVLERWLLPTETDSQYAPEVIAEPVDHLRAMAQAYLKGDPFAFSLEASKLRTAARALNPSVYPTEWHLKLEAFYNHADPFLWALALYALAWLALATAHLGTLTKTLTAFGTSLAGAGILVHAAGIAMRCIIAERPPVTNMYESVVWVSFGVMVFGAAFFIRYRTLTYALAALPVSLLCLLLLRQLPVAMPPNIDPLVPVLRSNFWLTVHVLCITLSYAAFALATGFGHIVLFRYIRNPLATNADALLHLWLYRVLQLGVLLLAAGTILGGVWANYSWGRFWGWDPKETWALIALLCYIVVLHGRIAGWWREFGLASASVICFCAVLMTWYGVNFVLGKGLHSYGFGLGGEAYVATFVALDLAYVALAATRYLTREKQPA